MFDNYHLNFLFVHVKNHFYKNSGGFILGVFVFLHHTQYFSTVLTGRYYLESKTTGTLYSHEGSIRDRS